MIRTKKITVAVLYQDGDVRLERIPYNLDAIWNICGGHTQEHRSVTGADGLVDIVNAGGGHAVGLKSNFTVPEYTGNVIIAAKKADRLRSLTYPDIRSIFGFLGIGGLLNEELLQSASAAAGTQSVHER